MRRSIIAYYILIAGCALCAGQDAAIAERDQAFVRAVDARDDQALERLLDEDLTWTDLNGNTRTKSEVIQTIPNIIIAENEQPLLKLYG